MAGTGAPRTTRTTRTTNTAQARDRTQPARTAGPGADFAAGRAGAVARVTVAVARRLEKGALLRARSG